MGGARKYRERDRGVERDRECVYISAFVYIITIAIHIKRCTRIHDHSRI